MTKLDATQQLSEMPKREYETCFQQRNSHWSKERPISKGIGPSSS
jgi:hypothetical protein